MPSSKAHLSTQKIVTTFWAGCADNGNIFHISVSVAGPELSGFGLHADDVQDPRSLPQISHYSGPASGSKIDDGLSTEESTTASPSPICQRHDGRPDFRSTQERYCKQPIHQVSTHAIVQICGSFSTLDGPSMTALGSAASAIRHVLLARIDRASMTLWSRRSKSRSASVIGLTCRPPTPSLAFAMLPRHPQHLAYGPSDSVAKEKLAEKELN